MHIYSFSQKKTNDYEEYTLKNRLKVCRAEKNMTQAELSKIVNIARQSIALIEAGKHLPSILLAIKLANAFDKKIEDIFYLEGD